MSLSHAAPRHHHRSLATLPLYDLAVLPRGPGRLRPDQFLHVNITCILAFEILRLHLHLVCLQLQGLPALRHENLRTSVLHFRGLYPGPIAKYFRVLRWFHK